MKKTTCILLCVTLVMLALSACSSGGNGDGIGQGDNNIGSNAGANPPASGTTAQTGTDTDAPASSEKKTIVFSTFWEDARFEEAKHKYEALHPNITIALTHIDTTDSTTEAKMEQYIKATNTAMLAGKGPDLLQLDVLTPDDFVKHGLLADLGEMMDGDPGFRKEDYFTNVLDNVRIGGKLYALPLSFFLMGFAGDAEAVADSGVPFDDRTWTWSDFIGTAKQLAASSNGKYTSALAYGGPEYLLARMVTDQYADFIDASSRQARFDTPPFLQTMELVKTMFDEGVVSSQGRGGSYFYDTQINSPWDYLVSLRERGEQTRLYAKPHAEGAASGGYFRTYRTVGISANSEVKAEAWDFVKFMMSEEIATPPGTAGIPINKRVFDGQIQQLKEQGTVKAYEEGPLQGLSFPVDEALLDLLPGFVNGAVHPVEYQSDTIATMIIEESKAYFAGQKSAEQVAKLLQNKATTYLNE